MTSPPEEDTSKGREGVAEAEGDMAVPTLPELSLESEGEEDRSDEDWSPDSPLSTREQPSVIVSRIRGTDKKEFSLHSDIWIRIS